MKMHNYNYFNLEIEAKNLATQWFGLPFHDEQFYMKIIQDFTGRMNDDTEKKLFYTTTLEEARKLRDAQKEDSQWHEAFKRFEHAIQKISAF